VTVNGEVAAIGGNGTGLGGGGSGGSVYVLCGVVRGSGCISADGGDARASAAPYGPSGGGGGRIAVLYDPVAQSNETVSPYLSAAAGGCSEWSAVAPGYGYPGTIYMANTALLRADLGGGQLIVPGWTNWTVSNLGLTNGVVVLPSGFGLHVLTDVVAQADGSLELNNINLQVDGKWSMTTAKQAVPTRIYGGPQSQTVIGDDLNLNGDVRFRFDAMTNEGMTLNVGGDLLLTNTAEMRVYGAPRYAANLDYGAFVSVAGQAVVAPGSWVYPYCYGNSGTGVLFHVGELTIMTNAGFNVVGLGYPGGGGLGPGKGSDSGGDPNTGGGGGGYGGRGGSGKWYDISPPSGAGGSTYGNSNAPVLGGSGGGGYTGSGGGNGGGVIRIEASNGNVRVDGTLTANGNAGVTYGGGGSGGSIFLMCRTLTGAGLLTANGGARGPANAGGGGGGRIAVRAQFLRYQGTATVSGGIGYNAGETGTIVWFLIPPRGTVFAVR
jgi:hypothetical protein